MIVTLVRHQRHQKPLLATVKQHKLVSFGHVIQYNTLSKTQHHSDQVTEGVSWSSCAETVHYCESVNARHCQLPHLSM